MKTHNYGKIAFLSPKLSNDMEFVVISEIFGNICHHSPNLYPLFFNKRRNLFSTPEKNPYLSGQCSPVKYVWNIYSEDHYFSLPSHSFWSIFHFFFYKWSGVPLVDFHNSDLESPSQFSAVDNCWGVAE